MSKSINTPKEEKVAAKAEPAKINAPEQEFEKLTQEQKVVSYIQNSHSAIVELNPFLKSFYPLASLQSPAQYLHQGESKRISRMIGKMQQEGQILLTDNSYLRLGTFYYAEGDTKTRYWDIDTVKIIAIKK